MSEISELCSEEIEFLEPYLPRSARLAAQPRGSGEHESTETTASTNIRSKDDTLPFVTLTYASSLDGMISLAPGLRTTLSGPETKSMTHYLRLHHDAILVGVGTAIPDDPSLNCRYPGATLEAQPRPVIVDPRGRWDYAKSKLARITVNGQGKEPWLIHAGNNARPQRTTDELCEHINLATSQGSSGDILGAHLSWRMILTELKSRGIDSVMIEGGATIISSLLAQPELLDSVIITLAPTWLGVGGVAAIPAARTDEGQRVNAARLESTSWRQFGADAVLCGRSQN